MKVGTTAVDEVRRRVQQDTTGQAQTGELLLSPLRDAIERRAPLSSDGGVDVRAAELGVRAEVVGAMVMAFDGENERARHGGSGLSGPRDGAQGLERGASA